MKLIPIYKCRLCGDEIEYKPEPVIGTPPVMTDVLIRQLNDGEILDYPSWSGDNFGKIPKHKIHKCRAGTHGIYSKYGICDIIGYRR